MIIENLITPQNITIPTMKRTVLIRFIGMLFLVYLAFTYVIPYLTRGAIVSAEKSTSAISDQNENDNDNVAKLSLYENPDLGFRLKYPNDFRLAEVSNSLESKTVVFERIPFAPETGAFLSVNSTKRDSVITFNELKKIMTDTIRNGPGTSILDMGTVNISGIPGYKIVQNHAHSPYGRDAMAIFIGAVRDKTIYMLSSLSTDIDALQEMVDSFEFIR
jgi:hypothetical protein